MLGRELVVVRVIKTFYRTQRCEGGNPIVISMVEVESGITEALHPNGCSALKPNLMCEVTGRKCKMPLWVAKGDDVFGVRPKELGYVIDNS